jgi:hypothetical protein
MRRKGNPVSEADVVDVEAALAAMGTEELRELVRDILVDLDGRAHSRVVDSLIKRAAHGGAGWLPAPLDDNHVSEVLTFAKAARRVGRADPSEVDEHLRSGSGAFLRKGYAAARRIFGALLQPVGEGEIDLGQDEMAGEVLGIDPAECAAQYVVSVYMISAPSQRAEAVWSAIDEVRGVGNFWEPIREMERVAVEPLPQLADFFPLWRAVVLERTGGVRGNGWDTGKDRWVREVVRRMDGADGLAKMARATRRADDLRAWCRSLVEVGDWKAALPAFEEAAEIVAENECAVGEFLDGAALAAQQLGRSDLPGRLERAWRAAPNMLRLRRWLGSTGVRAAIKKRAADALEVCPKRALRQRALFHLLRGDFAAAADLLAAAPGLGWSEGEHPGHLLFPLFESFLGGKRMPESPHTAPLAGRRVQIEELEQLIGGKDEHRLAAPEVERILQQAGIDGIPDAGVRGAVLAAMRKAAEKRLAGVTGQKRRGYYSHAAQLAAACVACDGSPEAAQWLSAMKTKYRRFPALRAGLDRVPGSA